MTPPQEGIVIGALLGSGVGCFIFGGPIPGLILILAGIWYWTLENRRKKKMISGNHSHFCPKCQGYKWCPLVTHCKRPEVYPCWVHQEDSLPDEKDKIDSNKTKGESK